MNTSWRGVQKHSKPYKHSKDSVENVYKKQHQNTFKKVSKNTPNLPNTQKTILNNPKNGAPKHLMFFGGSKSTPNLPNTPNCPLTNQNKASLTYYFLEGV